MGTLLPLALLLLTLVTACDRDVAPASGPRYGAQPDGVSTRIYLLAVHPLHNPVKMFAVYQPLVDGLNLKLNGSARFALEASVDYQDFERKYRQRGPEFLLPNPWQTLDAQKRGYQVIAMAGEADDFKGLIIVRRDSGVAQPADLRGKVVSYPSYTALAACIMPQYYLHQHGIDVTRDITNRYVGSQESSIMNVYLRESAAGATWPPPWRLFQREHPREAAELRVAWETESLLNNSVMVRDDVPAEVRQQVQEYLLGLEATAEGKRILAGAETARFGPADDGTYEVVRRYVARFEREVRPVEKP
jgi:phosphonate transport system substrate-binding protein